MALEVIVGPPVLTINNGYTFLVSELDGSVTPASDQGLYSRDTRYLSGYQLYINGKPWALLNAGAIAHHASQTHLINPMVATQEGVIAPGTVGLLLGRTLAEALHEDLVGFLRGRPPRHGSHRYRVILSILRNCHPNDGVPAADRQGSSPEILVTAGRRDGRRTMFDIPRSCAVEATLLV